MKMKLSSLIFEIYFCLIASSNNTDNTLQSHDLILYLLIVIISELSSKICLNVMNSLIDYEKGKSFYPYG